MMNVPHGLHAFRCVGQENIGELTKYACTYSLVAFRHL
jgi:hypothetical protein